MHDQTGTNLPPAATTKVVTHRRQGWRRFFLLALLLHVPLFAYPILRLCHWLALNGWVTTLIFVPLFFSQILARLYLRGTNSFWLRGLRRLSDLWLGTSPMLLMTLLVFELIVWLTGFAQAAAAWWVLGVSLTATLYGMCVAWWPRVIRVQLHSNKLSAPIRFVQLSDVHIGSRSHRFLVRVVEKIKLLEPQFVCITGDFIDDVGVTRHQLTSLQSLRAPIYFSIGNHERYVDLEQIETTLTDLGVQVLRDRSVAAHGIQFIGIDDHEDAGQVGRVLPQIPIAHDAFVILLYHRPQGMVAAAEAGVDLMLSGHTHNGQIKPFHWVVKRAFAQIQGLYCHGDMTLYVSSGTGTWGPIMRFGTYSEITLFDIHPC